MFRKQRAFCDTYPDLDKQLLAWFNEYMLRMNQDDSLYQEQLEDSIPVSGTDDSSIREPEYLDSKTGRVAKKNPSISSKAVAASGFKCAFDPAHHTFLKEISPESWEGMKEDGFVVIPKDFLYHIGGLSFSTTRGILFAKTEGTDLNSFIMPIIYMDQVIHSDMKIPVQE